MASGLYSCSTPEILRHATLRHRGDAFVTADIPPAAIAQAHKPAGHSGPPWPLIAPLPSMKHIIVRFRDDKDDTKHSVADEAKDERAELSDLCKHASPDNSWVFDLGYYGSRIESVTFRWRSIMHIPTTTAPHYRRRRETIVRSTWGRRTRSELRSDDILIGVRWLRKILKIPPMKFSSLRSYKFQGEVRGNGWWNNRLSVAFVLAGLGFVLVSIWGMRNRSALFPYSGTTLGLLLDFGRIIERLGLLDTV
ncbi:hypothetical protein K458DRAFT_399001 [Lentithecium fluviatile CBS 122367]|uniref:Uncharacterized protein n=1 Tax=Lentithecium fluviatile CBS 122367 TaxID=1168545 RepID=A0A6G1JLP7_9PLEO|nr:hypothetical protein K458DRAFT_399001 [Lentithecium fluviatile CBS 122367]